jgi:hypothetical protein
LPEWRSQAQVKILIGLRDGGSICATPSSGCHLPEPERLLTNITEGNVDPLIGMVSVIMFVATPEEDAADDFALQGPVVLEQLSGSARSPISQTVPRSVMNKRHLMAEPAAESITGFR